MSDKLDSDDLLLPNALEYMFRAAEETNAEVVHPTAFLNMHEHSDGTFDSNLELQTDKNPVQGLLPTDRNARLANCFMNYKMLSEDEPFAIALYCFAERYLCIPNYFHVYRRRRSALTGSVDRTRAMRAAASIVEGHRCIMETFNRFSETEIATDVRNACIQSFFSRMLENFILKFYTSDNIIAAETIRTFIEGLRSELNENVELAAHLFQATSHSRFCVENCLTISCGSSTM